MTSAYGADEGCVPGGAEGHARRDMETQPGDPTTPGLAVLYQDTMVVGAGGAPWSPPPGLLPHAASPPIRARVPKLACAHRDVAYLAYIPFGGPHGKSSQSPGAVACPSTVSCWLGSEPSRRHTSLHSPAQASLRQSATPQPPWISVLGTMLVALVTNHHLRSEFFIFFQACSPDSLT